DVADEVVERVVDGAGGVVRASQAGEGVEHAGAMGIEVVVELPPTAELKQVQSDAPPSQETGLVGNGLGVAAIGKLLQPVVQVREEVSDGLGQRLASDQGRPALRRTCRTWFCTSATLRA